MSKRTVLFIVIGICLISQLLYGQYQDFVYGDTTRTYAMYESSLPPNLDGYPLIIGLHGSGSDGLTFMATTAIVQKAIKEKFYVACPNGLRYNLLTWWNAGGIYEDITQGTDDIGFISALIDTMIMNNNVDTTRIYVMGFSNGAAMAYRVAAELSDKIAAMGVSSGQMLYEYCNPEFPVPIIHFHGLSDDIFPYYGAGDSTNAIPPVDSTMAAWRRINDCSSDPDTIYNENGIIGRQWPSSTGLTDIILYTNPTGEHEWPRPSNWGITATDSIWDFFTLHTRSGTTLIGKDDKVIPGGFNLYQNYPNPFNPSTNIKFTLAEASRVVIKVYNIVGQEIETLVDGTMPAGLHETVWQPNGLASGVYFYKMKAGEYTKIRKLILLR